MDLNELKKMNIKDLTKLAQEAGISDACWARR